MSLLNNLSANVIFHVASYEWRRDAYVSASGGTRVKTPNYTGSLVDSCLSSFFRSNASNTSNESASSAPHAFSHFAKLRGLDATTSTTVTAAGASFLRCMFFGFPPKFWFTNAYFFLSFDELVPLFYLFISYRLVKRRC